ncbi:MAG: hypothetical protein IKS55_06445 [Oscillospiraceae bacterium]|nr:hypothetical protein [Oscillospiraceae bacterium]
MFSREECLRQYGSDYYVQKKVNTGDLFRVGKGIYSEKASVPELALLSFKYPHAVLTMHSAFYLHDLTDVIPEYYDFATGRNAAKIPDGRVKQYFVPDEYFPEGIDFLDYKGYSIPIYDKERMLIELMRYKTKLPYDYYKELILNYRKAMPQLDIQKIQDYALAAPKSGKILDTLQAEVL